MTKHNWIDVNEKLPDKEISLVIICVEEEHGLSKEDLEMGFSKYWVTAGYCEMKTYKGADYPVWTMEMDGRVVPGNVILWMPMPEHPFGDKSDFS